MVELSSDRLWKGKRHLLIFFLFFVILIVQRCCWCRWSYSTRRHDSSNEWYQFWTYLKQWCCTSPTWNCQRCQVKNLVRIYFFKQWKHCPSSRSIKLVIAKRWNDHHGLLDDNESDAYFPLPHQAIMNNNARQDPIRPIDPRQWVAQTNAVLMRRRTSLSPPRLAANSTLSSSSPSSNSPHRIQKFRFDLNLTRNSDMETICRAMQQPQSGLDIRDRLWLKIILKNSFLGSDLVHWLY